MVSGKFIYRPYTDEDISSIKKLLNQSDLPYEDIVTSDVDFIVASKNDEIIGTIGIEKFDTIWLLRSFAVDTMFQGAGVGSTLFKLLLESVENENIDSVHLLTTTAENYFKKKGFLTCKRESVPIVLEQTAEFSQICPASSVYMVLKR